MPVALSQLAILTLNVACSRCDRKGRYRLTNLIATHGPDKQLPELAVDLRGDCPNRDTFTANKCDVYYPGLGQSPTDASEPAK